MTREELITLPPEERLALISMLWDSLRESAPLPEAQAQELAHRLRTFDQDRADGLPWEAFRGELSLIPG